MINLKKSIALLSALALAGTMLAGCTDSEEKPEETTKKAEETTAAKEDNKETETEAPAPAVEDTGKVLNIHCWNEEFKGYFETYYKVPDGITVNWVITPNEGGAYQQKLDAALLAQGSAAADDKVDMFLGEMDYIKKYSNSDLTMDISQIGITDADLAECYGYTVSAASDANGAVKGVTWQCNPAAMLYRRSIAKDVLGTDVPEEVQAQLDTWEKFADVAAKAKEKGYYMTASDNATYRAFLNTSSAPWVDADLKVNISSAALDWLSQAKTFVDNGYTQACDIWAPEANEQMFKTGKTMTFFGPAWYYSACMGNAWDAEKGCVGDWGLCQGPSVFNWGGTWLLAAAGTDNMATVADIMKTFTSNEDVLSKLVSDNKQFVNNKKIIDKFANDPNYGNEFFNGQNDVAMFATMTDGINADYVTQYEQVFAEQFPGAFRDYLKGTITEEQAYTNFYKIVKEKHPELVTP